MSYGSQIAKQEAGEAYAAGTAAAAQENRKSMLLQESAVANAGASGVNPASSTVVSKVGDIAKWGTYNARRSERRMRGCGISVSQRAIPISRCWIATWSGASASRRWWTMAGSICARLPGF